MNIHVKLSTTLRQYVADYIPTAGLSMQLPDATTIAMLAQHLALPENEIAIVMVNGRHATMEHLLADGDQVAYFPAVGGG